MPKQGSAGFSDNTPMKEEHFRMILGTHMRIVKGLLGRQRWMVPFYVYGDLNAGPGDYSPAYGFPLFGSPVIALTVAKAIGLPLQAAFYEQDATTIIALRRALLNSGMWADPQRPDLFFRTPEQAALIYEGDYHTNALTALEHFQEHHNPKSIYGLLYSDENGNCPPFALLGDYAKVLPRLDVLIHVAATPIKRQFYSPVHPLMKRLDELMAMVPKDYWMIREPYGRHQWTFLIGTNWHSFPRFRTQ